MKVKVKSIEKKQWNEKSFYDITLEGDNKQYTCWNDSVQLWKAGQEVDAEIREHTTKKGTFYISAPTQFYGKSGGWKPKDKREIAINCTTALVCKMAEKQETIDPNALLVAVNIIYDHIYKLIKD